MFRQHTKVGHDADIALTSITYLNMKTVITVASVRRIMWPKAERIGLRNTASLQTGFKCRLWSDGINGIYWALIPEDSDSFEECASNPDFDQVLYYHTDCVHTPAVGAGPLMCHSAKCSCSFWNVLESSIRLILLMNWKLIVDWNKWSRC